MTNLATSNLQLISQKNQLAANKPEKKGYVARAIWPIFEEWPNILVRIWPEKSGYIDRAMAVAK